jgi:hypothetical protein
MISEASFNENFGTRVRDGNRLAAFAAHQSPYDMFIQAPSGFRKARSWAGDLLLIGCGWALLIGILMHPEAQIVGIAATAVALAFSRKG